MFLTTKKLMIVVTLAGTLFSMAHSSFADCKFSGGKIFSLTKEKGKKMQVLCTFSGSGNWWLFQTNDKTFMDMLSDAFFNRQRIYITGNKPKCQVQRIVKFGSATPKLGGDIKRLFAL